MTTYRVWIGVDIETWDDGDPAPLAPPPTPAQVGDALLNRLIEGNIEMGDLYDVGGRSLSIVRTWPLQDPAVVEEDPA